MRSYPVRPLKRTSTPSIIRSRTSIRTRSDLKGTTPITELVDTMGRVKTVIDRALPPPRIKGRPKQYHPRAGACSRDAPGSSDELELTGWPRA